MRLTVNLSWNLLIGLIETEYVRSSIIGSPYWKLPEKW